jgi:hypothetical protein
MDISSSCIARSFTALAEFLGDRWHRARGTLRPASVFYSIMSMVASGSHGYASVLDHLKKTTGDILGWEDDEAPPCPSSLSEARRKLRSERCVDAFQFVRSQCSHLREMPKVAYREFNLVAGDMTTLALPAYKDITRAFGSPKNRIGGDGKAPKATLTALWNISTNSPIDWRLERCYASERFAISDMIHQLGPGDLFIGDRGYPSYRMLRELRDSGAAYLIRLPIGKRGGFREARDFAEDDSAWDRRILLHEHRGRIGEPTMPVRLMKRRLDSGDVAVFVTNLLSSKEHRRRALCDLYCYRWDIETAFKEMKCWHGLENFRARYADGIHQEVAALMTFMLLTAELECIARKHHEIEMKDAPEGAPQEPAIRWNRKRIAEYVGYILAAASQGENALKSEFDYAMRMLWRHRQKRRPGRKFQRIAKSANSKWKRNTYNTDKNGAR